MVALIDGDSMIYILAYNYREINVDPGSSHDMHNNIDSFMNTILTMTHADYYMACIGCPEDGKKSFRQETYRYNIYKGDRPPESEWMTKWKPVIRDYLVTKWKFFWWPNLEADDLIAYTAWALNQQQPPEVFVVCSPDKDLQQITGLHYDYKKQSDQNGEVLFPVLVTEAKAWTNMWLQVVMGDKSDSIAGVPGLGVVKASKLFEDANDPLEYQNIAMQAYCKYFGPYYGPIIFRETYSSILLMTPEHPEFQRFGVEFAKTYQDFIHPVPGPEPSIFE